MATKQPNILILWGDDIGMWNISHFSQGMMGYRTPNIDRVAKEGVTFTDWYGQQSCPYQSVKVTPSLATRSMFQGVVSARL